MKGINNLSRLMLVVAMISMTGCLFTVDSDRHDGDQQWSDQQLARIETGSTSQSWVQTTFGDPVRRTEYEDGSVVWHYENTSRVDTEVGLFLLFSIDVESEVEKRLSIEMKDGVVTDYWVESDSH